MHDGLSQLSVLSMYQDRLGRMWFGTEEGINVYDGNSVQAFKNFEANPSVTGINVGYIVGDSRGDVYFTADNALMRYDLSAQRFSCLLPTGVYALYMRGDMLYYGEQSTLKVMDVRHRKTMLLCRFPADIFVKAILVDHRGNLYIGTNEGLYIKARRRQAVCLLPKMEIDCLFEDSRRNVWISTRDQGCYVRHADGTSTHLTAPHVDSWRSTYNFAEKESVVSTRIASDMVRGIAEDSEGNIWLGTFLGLDRYDPRTGLFTVFAHTNNPYSISHSSVFPVVRDDRGTIWLGTYFGGVNYFNPQRDVFTFYSADVSRSDCLSYPFVGHITEDRRGDLWICTEGGGLNRMNRRTGAITHYMMNAGSNSIAHNNVKNIVYDRAHDRLYIGTHTGGLSIMDIPTERFDNVWTRHPEYRNECGDQIFDMCILGNRLIFTTQRGIWQMDMQTCSVKPLFPSGRGYGNTYFHIDSRGYIWIAGGGGVWRIKLDDERQQRLYRCGKRGLGRYMVSDITEDVHHRVWLVTRGSGLYSYDAATDRFTAYTTANSGIISDFCYEIEPYHRQFIINSDRGITIFDPRSKEFRNIEFSPDFPLSGIHRGCGMFVAHDDEIFVGGTNGLVAFRADRIHNSDTHYRMYISRLMVNDVEVAPGDDTGILTVAPYYTHRIDLDYDENDVAVVFSTNNYAGEYRHPVYEYRLQGYDNKWMLATGRRINYTKISPGHYTLVVRERPAAGQPVVHETRMDIIVHPPFYKTTLAYLFYILLTFAILYYVYKFKRSQLLLRTSLEMEKRDKRNIEELNRAKLRFFTSISHEFRTPLTLIIAKIDAIIGDIDPGSPFQKRMKGLMGNARHLLELVNELLDFRKMEQGYIQLHAQETDAVGFARGIYQSFVEYAQSRHIRYLFTASQPSIDCWFDVRQMEKVIYNLLSNAFKYVRDDTGSVELQLLSDAEHVIIRVIDNGIGIDRKDIDRIFDRFYQAGNSMSDIANAPGTGIGLALVREIVSLHHGDVRVESSPGYGSVFIVTLLKGKSHFTDKELSVPAVHQEVAAENQEVAAVAEAISEGVGDEELVASDDTQYSILLVEDNEDLLITLRDLFARTCRVLLARNGSEGLQTVRAEMPDLVVSDVMMPVMSGTEMCKTIKDDISICHIPVVLLTAMGSTEHTINGLKCGADDYISKPFDPKLLLVRCNNLIRSRILLRRKFGADDHSDSDLIATNPLDKKFMKDCDAFIERNLDNSDLSFDDMSQSVAMGRTKFFKKFKTLTGLTPNEYVLSYRLKLSAVWLREKPELQISDVAYRLGFASPRYFSHCFKAKYGVTPKQYRT